MVNVLQVMGLYRSFQKQKKQPKLLFVYLTLYYVNNI